eukprot:15856058-Heterocapsa_arctica.AAC.1
MSPNNCSRCPEVKDRKYAEFDERSWIKKFRISQDRGVVGPCPGPGHRKGMFQLQLAARR